MLATVPRRLRPTNTKMIAATAGGGYRFHQSGP
jgi:hypothetical protein